MNSRERVRKAIRHELTDRVPVDLGATAISGIHVVELKKLRAALGLSKQLPRALDPMTLIGEVDEDVRIALEIDCIGLYTKDNSLGLKSDHFKEWTLPDGTVILMREDFACSTDAETGKLYAYPQGDTSVSPSAYMAAGSLYFDNYVRQENIEEKTEWNARKDYKDQYSIFSEETLKELMSQAGDYYRNTEYALVGSYGGGGLGDIFHVPGSWLKETKGIREVADWYMAMYLHRDYLMDLFAMQTEITLKNLHLYYEAVGNKIEVLVHSGTDFAHQSGLLASKDIYREMYMPYYQQVNHWIHKNTEWKTFMHSCGAVSELIGDFIEAGFDILNPVQVSAKDMNAADLKRKFGKNIVFWGGGCDPQETLPNGTPEDVYCQTKQNAAEFSKGGGFVGGNVHNLQYEVPIENFLAEIRALKDTIPMAE